MTAHHTRARRTTRMPTTPLVRRCPTRTRRSIPRRTLRTTMARTTGPCTSAGQEARTGPFDRSPTQTVLTRRSVAPTPWTSQPRGSALRTSAGPCHRRSGLAARARALREHRAGPYVVPSRPGATAPFRTWAGRPATPTTKEPSCTRSPRTPSPGSLPTAATMPSRPPPPSVPSTPRTEAVVAAGPASGPSGTGSSVAAPGASTRRSPAPGEPEPPFRAASRGGRRAVRSITARRRRPGSRRS
jgi:hypothetical protein